MARPALEVADLFRDHGPAWREANRGHVSLGQLKVMSAIEDCRTAALGGHVARCENQRCGFTSIAYNSCRNRHCPKCQGAAAREWMAAREADLLPVPYFHVVFTLPAEIGDIAYQNKAVIYDLLFRASSETMLTIAADPKHLGARIGITAVLHTWGSAMTHHPHVHMIVPGGGISLGGDRWIAARPNFFLPVLVLSRLFRRLMLEKLVAAHAASKLTFFGTHAALADAVRFAAFLAPLKNKRWFVYAKQPFAGPRAVLAYLSRYTHRVAISNSRLLNTDGKTVTFRVKNYRVDGVARYTTMTLDIAEFIRRFLLHVLPKGQHRIRHYGLFANGTRVDNIALARKLIGVTAAEIANAAAEPMHDEEATERKAGDSRARASHTDLSVLRQQNAHHRGLPARPDASAQSLAVPAIDPDRYVMTMLVEAQRNDDASSWSPASLADPLPIRRRRSCRAARSHSPTAPSRPVARPSLAKHKPSRRDHHFARQRPNAQIPIAIAAPPPVNLPRVPSLQASGRRPRCPWHRPRRPASGTLNKLYRLAMSA